MGRMLLVLLAAAAGCACDSLEWARDHAGSGAIDCGYAALGEVHDPYYQCIVDAFRRGDAFFVVLQQQGRDSRVERTWASDGVEVRRANYDGDPSGGSGTADSVIYEIGCGDPRVQVVGSDSPSVYSVSPDQEWITCTETFRNQVCP